MTGLVQRQFAEPLSLDDIAAAGSVGRSRCCALFRRYVGRTPNEYLTDRRLEEAKRLLDGTNGSVAEIARTCGFSSSSYFIGVFRRRTGLTPKAYRTR
ncbi:helix-turn-helix transcriptional regulator, partial [Bifidobacterium callitrichos]|uniref:AraC family transcriptional regulator n=1 Tax=Bifidobacterium callitrichos DSM 23973 TaxID=1437609 RepID=A0A087A163_9BIFI